ncbi:MAG: DUF3788 domain-containing protein [Acidobacteriia bacterium]|nr:DUF3788 domain-containing protein [Terriglobia bacterium]
MLPNAFAGQARKPSDHELTAALGAARAIWDQLVGDLVREHGVDVQEWNSYSTRAGWSLRLKHKDRNIVYLTPSQGCFMASFALSDKAVKAARQSRLPARVIEIIDEAKRYAEGTAVRIDVKSARDITVVKKLAAIKLAS